MKQTNVSFRTEVEKLKSLDTVAAALDRDRSYVLNQAIASYLDLYEWQLKHIQEGLRQADAGDFATEEEVAKVLKRKSR